MRVLVYPRRFLYLGVALAMTSCASLKVSDFSNGRPPFDPTNFFTGRTRSWGVMENRGGAPMKRVTTQTVGHWENKTLHLQQDLTIGNASSHRSWLIRKLDPHHYEATANDIIGTARGEAYGNVFHWKFTLALSLGNPLATVEMSQWMYLQPDGRTLINHSTILKLGLVVAQVTEQFQKE